MLGKADDKCVADSFSIVQWHVIVGKQFGEAALFARIASVFAI